MSSNWFSPLLRAELSELSAYEPTAAPAGAREATSGLVEVRLDANESPCLLSAEARAGFERALTPRAPNRYPDARTVELRRAIAASMDADVDPDEVLVGVGSDEVIALMLTALDRPRGRAPSPTLVTPSPTFAMYRLSGRARGFKVVEVPLDAGWDLDVSAMRRAIEMMRPNVVFVATPNNPTGNRMSSDRLTAVIEAASDSLVIVDEAYVDFAPSSELALFRRYPNVGVLRTISKIGFASLRVGWLVGPAALVHEIDKVRQPYNVPEPSQRGAIFVLRELGAEMRRIAGEIVRSREKLAGDLTALGFSVMPSAANFLWVEAPGFSEARTATPDLTGTRKATLAPADELAAALAARGVFVKSFGGRGGRLTKRLRITVGSDEENRRLCEELAACR
jgi:histidinol-phosphate aminotransferase